MAWLRLDDGFTHHPKFEGWPPSRRWAWLEVMEYCARYNTRGRIPNDLSLLPKSTTETLLKQAEEAGWIDHDPQGGRLIHDWPKYNPQDPGKAARQARWRATRRRDVDDPVDTVVDTTVDAATPSTERLPRARARAPVPVPSPTVSSEISSEISSSSERASAQEPDDDDDSTNEPPDFAEPEPDDLTAALDALAPTPTQRARWLLAATTDPDRIRACLHAAHTAQRPAAYLDQLIRKGDWPRPQTPPGQNGPAPPTAAERRAKALQRLERRMRELAEDHASEERVHDELAELAAPGRHNLTPDEQAHLHATWAAARPAATVEAEA